MVHVLVQYFCQNVKKDETSETELGLFHFRYDDFEKWIWKTKNSFLSSLEN